MHLVVGVDEEDLLVSVLKPQAPMVTDRIVV